jgi:hypothetical protein
MRPATSNGAISISSMPSICFAPTSISCVALVDIPGRAPTR